MKSYNFLKNNFLSQSSIQITFKNCLKVTFNFIGLKIIPLWIAKIKTIAIAIIFYYCMGSQSDEHTSHTHFLSYR